jgi:hypothetical protein
MSTLSPCAQCSLSTLCVYTDVATYFMITGCHYCGKVCVDLCWWLENDPVRRGKIRVPPDCPLYLKTKNNPQYTCNEKECRAARHRWRCAAGREEEEGGWKK